MRSNVRAAVAASLLIVTVAAGSYAVQIAVGDAWEEALPDAAVVDETERADPPKEIRDDPTLRQWRVTADVAQHRSGGEEAWRLTARIALPATSGSLGFLRNGSYPAATLLEVVVGRVITSAGDLRPSSYVVTQHGVEGDAVIALHATTSEPSRDGAFLYVSEPSLPDGTTGPVRRVRVTSADDVTGVWPEPVHQTPRSVELRVPGDESGWLVVRVGPRARDEFFAEGVRRAWTGLLGLVAWLVVHLLLARPLFGTRAYSVTARRVLLALVVAEVMTTAIAVLTYVSAWLEYGLPALGLEETLQGAPFDGAYVALAGVLLAGAAYSASAVTGATPSPVRWSAAAAGVLAAYLGLALWLSNADAVKTGTRDAVVAATAGVLVVSAAIAVAARAGRAAVGPPVVTAALGALLSLLAPLTAFEVEGPVPAAVAYTVEVATGAAVVLALAFAGWVAAGRPRPPAPRLTACAATAVAVVAAWPFDPWPGGSWYAAYGHASHLAAFGTLVAVVVVVRALRDELQDGRVSLDRARRIRRLGIAFALLAIYPPTALVSYVPVPFLACAALAVWWALPEPGDPAVAAEPDEATRRAEVAAILRARAAERVAARLRRKLTDKVESGDLTFADMEAKVGAVERTAAEARGSARREEEVFGAFAVPAWRQARAGATAGFVAGLPWVLTNVREIGARDYSVLTVLADTQFAVGRWTAFGFLFGACYPLLRGRTGLAKGWTAFVLVAAPTVAAAVASGRSFADQGESVLLALAQFFVHFMVLGLVADTFALRRAGMPGWRRLVELHNFRALVAWGTTVAVSFGAAVSSALVSGATAFLVTYLPQTSAPERSNTSGAEVTGSR